MPYNKSTQRKYGDSPLSKKGLALNKEIDKDTESGGYTGQPKQHGSPFEMRAKGYANSPMQKNFGSSLAINKKLDKDNMQGGLTGQPSGETGKLGSGPIHFNIGSQMKKNKETMANKRGVVKSPKKGGSSPAAAQSKAKRAKFGSDIQKFGGGLVKSTKQLGSQIKSGINKMGSNIKTGQKLTAGTYMGAGGSTLKKAANKKSSKTASVTKTPEKLEGINKSSEIKIQTTGTPISTRIGAYTPSKTKKTKAHDPAIASAKKSTGVLRSSGNKKAPVTKTPKKTKLGQVDLKTGNVNIKHGGSKTKTTPKKNTPKNKKKQRGGIGMWLGRGNYEHSGPKY